MTRYWGGGGREGMCPPGPPPCSRPLSNISSKKESFDSATLLYQEALKKSGHDYQLNVNPTPSKRKQRSRNVIRYNPPYNANVDTNVGHKFLRTIDECFPKSHAFHIIFYRNTLRLYAQHRKCYIPAQQSITQ